MPWLRGDLSRAGPACRVDYCGPALMMAGYGLSATACTGLRVVRCPGRGDRGAGPGSGGAGGGDRAAALPGPNPQGPKPKRGGGHKPGGQPGSPGSHLAWSEEPDDTVPHFPDG